MKQAWLISGPSADYGTFGRMVTQAGYSCHSLELPWRDNLPILSCIPAGDYTCKIRQSPRFGKVYEVMGVPRRTYILCHPANYAGARDKGYFTELEGCIALGEKVGIMKGQRCILVSRPAVRRFMEVMMGEDFTLHVISLSGER